MPAGPPTGSNVRSVPCIFSIVVRYRSGDCRPIRVEARKSRSGSDKELDFSQPAWLTAVRAAESKKAADIKVLDLRQVTSFADFFVLCTGSNPRQIQAISEEIDLALRQRGEHASNVEGFQNAEWVLADYGDLLVHVFSAKARAYYDLERLWRHATEVHFDPAT